MFACDLLCDCDKVHLCKAASAQTPGGPAPLIEVKRLSKYSYHLTQLLKIKDANHLWYFFYLHRKNVTCKTICLPHIGKSKCMLTVDDF